MYEFGGTEGIVTLVDSLEEHVGEIYDEKDEDEVLSREVGDDTYLVTGTHNLEDLFEEFRMNVKEEFDSTTVGGWITEQLGKIPAAGEKYSFENLDIIVTKANNKRVLELKIKVNPVEEEEHESGLEKLLSALDREKEHAGEKKADRNEDVQPVLIGGNSDTQEESNETREEEKSVKKESE